MNGRPSVLRSSLWVKSVSKNGLWAEKCVDSCEDTQIWFCQPLELRRTDNNSQAVVSASHVNILIRLAALRESTRHPVAYYPTNPTLTSRHPPPRFSRISLSTLRSQILHTRGICAFGLSLTCLPVNVNHLFHVSDRPGTLAVWLWTTESLQRMNESWIWTGYKICMEL